MFKKTFFNIYCKETPMEISFDINNMTLKQKFDYMHKLLCNAKNKTDFINCSKLMLEIEKDLTLTNHTHMLIDNILSDIRILIFNCESKDTKHTEAIRKSKLCSSCIEPIKI